MKYTALLALLLSAPAALAQDALFSVQASEVLDPSVVVALPDQDGDGAAELAIGRRSVSGITRVEVRSGRTGALRYVVGGAPGPQFYGHMIVALDDHDGDGVGDFAVVGSQSGAATSPPGVLDIRSGANGALLARFDPPAGTIFREDPGALALGDVDGDGLRDVLVAIFSSPSGSQPTLQAYSTATGAALYAGPGDPDLVVVATASVDDLDGDGVLDFAATVAVSPTWATFIELRSGATGALLVAHDFPVGLDSSPLVSVPDLDGDGLRDLANTDIFNGSVRLVSSATGAHLFDITSATGGAFGFGGDLADAGDVDFDGAPDLLISHEAAPGGGAVEAYSLADGHLIFAAPGTGEGCCFAVSLAMLPGADPEGFTSFAALDGGSSLPESVLVYRFAPNIGTSFCTPTPNSTGAPARIEARGTASVALDFLVLAADSLPAQQFGVFFYGPGNQETPFGNGLLCIAPGATGYGRLPVEQANAAGRIAHRFDYASPPSASTQIAPGSTWHFQAWFRDPAGGGSSFDTSDGVTLVFGP